MNTLDKILFLLKEQKKKQKDLMDYLGLGKTAFTGWKSGANTSYFKHIGKIADFLGVSTDYLLGKSDTKEPRVDIADNPDVKFAFFHGDGEITDSMRAELEGYINHIKKRPLPEGNGLTDNQLELIRLFDSAPPELQAAALAVLKSAEARLQAPDDDKANQ